MLEGILGMAKTVLVVGGAGYIGSHTALALEKAGYDVLVFDNLSTGHKEFLRFGRHEIGDLADKEALNRVFSDNNISAVMHFASSISVGESVQKPAEYYRNNVANSLNLLEVIRDHEVKFFIFSSTAAVYGSPQEMPIKETHPLYPINPYGRTKLAMEWMLQDFTEAYGLHYTVLRYFNAAGAAPGEWNAGIGEWHEPETHLIPLVLQAALDPAEEVKIFGRDYGTPDGTCIRDYIHVCDLADAHILAMERLMAGEKSDVFNLGNGHGYSVREVLECAREISKMPIRAKDVARRPGDPDSLVADGLKASSVLGWKPNFIHLNAIVATAWEWLRKRTEKNAWKR